MLQLVINGGELFDDAKQEFINTKSATLSLEHSLLSLSKWESKWHTPFLSDKEKTMEQTIDYIRCMTITPNVDPNIYLFLSNDNIQAVNDYISDPMTATWFNERQNAPSRRKEQPTAETLYYAMIAYQVPFECQKWHLNRLMTLLKVCEIRNSSSSNKMPKAEAMRSNAALNAARRKAMGTTG